MSKPAYTLAILYPGCISYEVMLALELLHGAFPVRVATPDGKPHVATNGLRVRADRRLTRVDPRQARVVVVPGGDPGDVLDDEALAGVLRGAHDAGALLGAICAGPLLLAKAGLLAGRRFTHGYGDHHKDVLDPYWEGAHLVDAPVVVDGPVVTARPEAHVDFAVELAVRSGAVEAGRGERLRAFYKGLRTTAGG